MVAVLVLICVSSGVAMAVNLPDGVRLVGAEAWQHYYTSFAGDKIPAVIKGAANLMSSIGIAESVGVTLMGVFIASFAGTTIDTSVRLQRYVIS